MTAPSIAAADTKTGTVTSNSSSWTLTYPTNLASGDLIIAVFACDGNGVIATWPSGWIKPANPEGDGTVTLDCAKKISDGTESGTFSLGLSASEQGCWRIVRIPAAEWGGTIGTQFRDTGATAGDVFVSLGASGASTSPDPDSEAPGVGAADFLWMAIAGSDHGNTTYTGFPANYTQQDHTTAGGHAAESGGATGAALGVAYRQLNASSEDPGAFTTDAAEGWGAFTIAVRPAAGVPWSSDLGAGTFQPPDLSEQLTDDPRMLARRPWYRRGRFLLPVPGLFVPALARA